MPMDALDLKILRILQTDSSKTNAEMADSVGLSQAACHRRVKALEASGVVQAYVAHLDPHHFGLKTSVVISVTLESQGKSYLRSFEDAVAKIPEVMECYLLAGNSDYYIRVMVKDPEDYERLHAEHLTALPHVARLQSQFSLRKVVRRTALPI